MICRERELSYNTVSQCIVSAVWQGLTCLIRSQLDLAKLKLQAVAPDW